MKKLFKKRKSLLIVLALLLSTAYFVQVWVNNHNETLKAQKAAIEQKELADEEEGNHESYQEPASDAGDIHTIDIYHDSFEPSTLTVKVNEIIAFKNDDTEDHDIKSDVEKFRTDRIKPGESLSVVQYEQPGTYTYHCLIHPQEKGTIIVVK